MVATNVIARREYPNRFGEIVVVTCDRGGRWYYAVEHKGVQVGRWFTALDKALIRARNVLVDKRLAEGW